MHSSVRWAVDLGHWEPEKPEWQALLSKLPPLVAAEVAKFKQVADQKRALVSRLLQRKVVSDLFSVPLSAIQIDRTKGGKPFCSNTLDRCVAPNFNFNVSHEVHMQHSLTMSPVRHPGGRHPWSQRCYVG